VTIKITSSTNEEKNQKDQIYVDIEKTTKQLFVTNTA